jgi:hypothetical protein
VGTSTDNTGRPSSVAVLRQFVRKPRVQAEEEKCELCAKRIGEGHQHLLELANRHVLCACEPCAILFSNHTAARYRRIPRQVRRLREFAIGDFEWDSLLIPINLAFFFHNSAEARVVAHYPSPAGAMQSQLDLEYWAAIVERCPALNRLESDVEALLVNRVSKPAQYYLAPIDHCYRLVGILRKNWRGLSGGQEVWKEIDSFFEILKRGSVEVTHA